MLIKHGLFARRNTEQSTQVGHQYHTHTKEVGNAEHITYITPGHIAAIKSAVSKPMMVVQSAASDELNRYQAEQSSPSKRLTIGEGVKIECTKIEGCYHLLVEGAITTHLDCEALTISANGQYKGSAEVTNAEIYGEFNGDLIVTDLLQIHSGARVRGNVRYGQLSIAEGGTLSGDIAQFEGVGEPLMASVMQLRPH